MLVHAHDTLEKHHPSSPPTTTNAKSSPAIDPRGIPRQTLPADAGSYAAPGRSLPGVDRLFSGGRWGHGNKARAGGGRVIHRTGTHTKRHITRRAASRFGTQLHDYIAQHPPFQNYKKRPVLSPPGQRDPPRLYLRPTLCSLLLCFPLLDFALRCMALRCMALRFFALLRCSPCAVAGIHLNISSICLTLLLLSRVVLGRTHLRDAHIAVQARGRASDEVLRLQRPREGLHPGKHAAHVLPLKPRKKKRIRHRRSA